ncbi:MAG: hypothetical protein HYX94_06520 [Chloroflexi bacterium]|nr:hypothetical protein [Chloroflexota bacterium]
MSIENRQTGDVPRREKKSGTFLRGLRGKVLTKDAGLLKLRGIGASKEPGGYS